MWREYSLRIGLPQTNFRNLAESRVLMEAGNFFWWALGDAMRQPVSRLRGSKGQPVYAAISYVEESFPPDRLLEDFGLDDSLRFLVGLRAVKNVATEGRILFDRAERLEAVKDPERLWQALPVRHPRIRFGSIFAAPGVGGGPWGPCAPSNAAWQEVPAILADDDPIPRIRQAQETGRLGLIPEGWARLDQGEPGQVVYQVDPDRDTNATGLVYFASYVAFMDVADRAVLPLESANGERITPEQVARRRVLERRIAYLANASASDRLTVCAERFAASGQPGTLGIRYRLTRDRDGRLLCLSEALVAVPRGAEAASRPVTTAAARH